jgi:hypothetical protein
MDSKAIYKLTEDDSYHVSDEDDKRITREIIKRFSKGWDEIECAEKIMELDPNFDFDEALDYAQSIMQSCEVGRPGHYDFDYKWMDAK